VVLPLWVVENCPSPLLWPLAYTTACTSVQAVIVYCSVLWLKTASKAKSCRCILVSYDQNFYGAINSLSLSLSVWEVTAIGNVKKEYGAWKILWWINILFETGLSTVSILLWITLVVVSQGNDFSIDAFYFSEAVASVTNAVLLLVFFVSVYVFVVFMFVVCLSVCHLCVWAMIPEFN